MVASRLMDVATSAAGRTTQDSYGLKLERAVVAMGADGCTWWDAGDRPGGEPPFERDDDDDDDNEGERLSRLPPWSDEEDDREEVFLWCPLLPCFSELILPFGGVCVSTPI